MQWHDDTIIKLQDDTTKRQHDDTSKWQQDNKMSTMLSRRRPGFWWRPGCSRSSRRCSATPPLLLRVAVSWLQYDEMRMRMTTMILMLMIMQEVDDEYGYDGLGHCSWEPLPTCFIIRWRGDFDHFDPDTQSTHNDNDNPGPQYTILLVLVFMFESVIGLLAYVYQVRCGALVISWHDDKSFESLPGAFDHLSLKAKSPCWTFLQKHLSVSLMFCPLWHLLPVREDDRLYLFFKLPLRFAFEWLFKKIS